ncbi:MAG: S-layer homology domain-containing protein, partial [Acidimicrobiaceae bacterium]|nr:S-layer homology domain-containing protein [Acidimicrobiaceae bacterium]
TRSVVEEFEDGPNLGSYLGGRYFLHPSSVAIDGVAPDDCGSGLQFCATHSRPRPYEPGRLNVLIGVRESIAVSTPLDELGPGEWELSVEADGEVIGASHLPLTTHYDGTRWHAEYTDKSTGATTDLCDNDSRCHNTALEVVQTIGVRTTVEEYEDGPNLGTYASARYLLHPAGVPIAGSTPDRCGTGRKFCVVVAQLDVEKYLYGLQEVPVDWPLEALKAQAVAARSYAAATVVDRAANSDWADEPFNLYDSTADQVFTGWARESGCVWHAWCDAVDATAGEVVVYQAEAGSGAAEGPEADSEPDAAPADPADLSGDGEDSTEASDGTDPSGEETDDSADPTLHEPRIAQTFYSSSNGGHTAVPSDVWTDGIDLPFLLEKPDPYDAAYDPETGRERNPNAEWTRSYSIADLTRWLNNYTVRGESPLNISSLTGIDIARAPASGYTGFATITVHDGDRSTVLLRDGKPYGAWLFFAILNGCRTADGCQPPVGLKFTIEWPSESAPEPNEDPEPPDPPEEPPEPEDPQEPPPVIEFSDIDPEDYFHEPVLWSVGEQISQGATTEMFGPLEQVSRAEFAEMLWRFAGSPTPDEGTRVDFDDVAEDAPYRDAVDLLAEYGVTTGTSERTFSPDMILRRAQASTFLWRFAGMPDWRFEATPGPNDCGTGVQFCVVHRPFDASSPNVIGVRELIAVSTPLDELGPGEWELAVEADGEVIGVSHLPLTTHYDGTRWHAEYTDKSTGATTDLCDNDIRCHSTVLEVAHTVGTRSVVEEFEDGPNLGSYLSGRYLLYPSSVVDDGPEPADQAFEDIEEDSYYSDAVRWMLGHRITTGTSPTTFSPEAPLTRAEAVTLIWRLAGLPDAFHLDLRKQDRLPPKMRR